MQELDNYKQHPSSRLLDDPLRIPVEQLVSRHHEQPWRVKTFSDMNDFASHPSAILSDGTTAVFAKLSEALHGLDQFEVELAGLRYLTERAGVLTPTAIGIVAVPDGVILVLEAVQPVERTEREWRDIGRALARIHQTKWDRCGFERQGYFGPLYQDNRPMRDWLTFYAERRLWPNLMGAINSGHLPTATIQQVEKLIARLPHMGIPEVAPALLHGDAQQNNFVSTPAGAVVIDPALHYGHPEYDLALVDYFQPVPAALFDGYREIAPIDPGFSQRRDLWRMSAYLGLVAVAGAEYLHLLTAALKQYV